MKRFILKALLPVSVTALVVAFAAAGEAAVRIKTSSVVTGATVTLGDLLEGVGQAAKVPVTQAPAPGKRISVRMTRISALARKHGLEWPKTTISSISVTRASNIVPEQTLVDGLREALAEQGIQDDMGVVVSNRTLRIHVAHNQEATVDIIDIRYNRDSGSFNAVVSAPAGNPNALRTIVRGRAFAITEIPILRERIAIGHKITEDDIDWIEIRSDFVRGGIVTDASSMIGKEPRRSIRPNRPVRARDLRRPVVIAKGATVSLIVSIPGMKLTVIGRALENGAMGDAIKVMNPQTRSVVEATIVAPGRALVRIQHNLISTSS